MLSKQPSLKQGEMLQALRLFFIIYKLCTALCLAGKKKKQYLF